MAIIYDDDGPTKWSMQQAFSRVDICLVNINLVTPESKARIDLAGLDVALSLDPRERPIVLYSFLNKPWLARDMRFHVLVGTERIGYVRHPFRLEEVLALATKLEDDQKTEDRLAQKLLGRFQQERLMGTLNHNIRHAIRAGGETLTEFLEDARKRAGLLGDDNEVIAQIEDWVISEGEEGLFPDEFFPGIFCDIEGTLWRNGKLNEEVSSRLVLYEENGSPITLWTGGDVKVLEQTMRSVELPWKVVSKWTMVGSRVEIVLDDEPQEAFREKYRIECDNFFQIS